MRRLLIRCVLLATASLLHACGSGGGSNSGGGTPNTPSGSSSSSSSSSSSGLSAEAFYASNLEASVVQSRCIVCHVSGGAAGDQRIVFSSGDNMADTNHRIFNSFKDLVANSGALILDSVRGIDHGGGLIFASTSDEYQDLQTYLALIGAGGSTTVNKMPLFEGVSLSDGQLTLRRAAFLLAGRQATEAELALAAQSEEGLKTALRGLMQGEHFHDFLITGANDRLLTDAFITGPYPDVYEGNAPFYRRLADRHYQMHLDGDHYYAWYDFFRFGAARAPLELIAHVVENDKPYTEILTADYTMVNPQSNEILGAGVAFSNDEPDQFKPGQNRGQIFLDNNYSGEFITGLGSRIDSSGPYLIYPQAGVLNDPIFLNRYPTTDTNRNRARARWTYYHFLDVDIEKSAPRTTDPEALADQNNPTLNNPACTVCHQLLDPVAGIFQNYGDEGWYRKAWGGIDSLPETYKTDPNSLYVWGDTWFRDMRTPGFNNQSAPDAANSVQWLAQQIVADPRFAKASVKFWWPTLMAEGLLEAPGEGVPDFDAKQRAFEQQTVFINQLAQDFAAGFTNSAALNGSVFNLKDLLVELIASDWFRAERAMNALDTNRRAELASAGVGRLLTPRELEAKTQALTGFTWGLFEQPDSIWLDARRRSSLRNDFRIYYGGIDSRGITERARELNTLMSNVAVSQALSLACPTVIFDFNRQSTEKLLFNFVDRTMTPTSHAAEIRLQLQHLHLVMLNEVLAIDSPELDASFDLLKDFWENRIASGAAQYAISYPDEVCDVPIPNWWDENRDAEFYDPEYMLGAWIPMMMYFMTDFKYLHL